MHSKLVFTASMSVRWRPSKMFIDRRDFGTISISTIFGNEIQTNIKLNYFYLGIPKPAIVLRFGFCFHDKSMRVFNGNS